MCMQEFSKKYKRNPDPDIRKLMRNKKFYFLIEYKKYV